MIDKNIKKFLLFITLCILLIGIVSATDVDSNTTEQTHTISEKITKTIDTVSEVKENVINDNKEHLKKDSNNDAVKTSTDQIATKISIDPIPDTSVDNSVIVRGTFTDINNNSLTYTNLKVEVNGEEYYSYTGDKGYYYGKYLISSPGTKTVIVSWEGNDKYAATSTKRSFNAEGQYPTQIILNNIKDVNLGDNSTINGYYYYDKSKPLKLTTMILNINGAKYYTKTNSNGYFTYNFKTNLLGTNTITVSYPGNTNFKGATATKTFNVYGQYSTYILLNNIKDVNSSEYTTISGYYYYNQNKPLRQTTMTININGTNYYARTNDNGYFTYNYKTSNLGTNKVIVSYAGTSKFLPATATKTFNVKYEGLYYTYIKLNNIKDVNKGEYTTINGYYYYNIDKPLKSTTMTININENKYYARTNDKGYFTYNYKTNKVGINTVTVTYPGNTNFKAATTTETFNVKRTGPEYTYITINNIKEVTLGEITTISGYYYYDEAKPLRQTTMTININGAEYYAKTNDNGYFTYNYKTKKGGINTVTVSFPGNTNFKTANSTKTFNVKAKPTIIKIYAIDTIQYSDNATISGYLVDSDWNDLHYTGLTVIINGNNYITRTDDYGYFTLNFKTNKVGKNNITVIYAGNDNYLRNSTKTTFTVTKKDTELTLYSLTTVPYGEYIVINGKYTDNNGNPLKYTTITLKINGAKYYTKTDQDGYFYYYYKTNKEGTNNVTASYPGTSNYYGDTISSTFIVTGKAYTLELNIYELTGPYPITHQKVGNDYFDTFYQTYDAQNNKGVYVECYAINREDLGEPPNNIIIDATFYFKNKSGQIYTDSYDDGYGDSMYHNLVSGYTPYKVKVTYRRITDHEKYLWNNGYGYNPFTTEWTRYY